MKSKTPFKSAVIGFAVGTAVLTVGSVLSEAVGLITLDSSTLLHFTTNFFLLMAALAIIEATEKKQ